MNQLSYEEIKKLLFCFDFIGKTPDFARSLCIDGENRVVLNFYSNFFTIQFEKVCFHVNSIKVYGPRFGLMDNRGGRPISYSFKFSDFDILINEDLEELDDTMKDLIFRGNIPTFEESLTSQIRTMIKITSEVIETIYQ